MLLFLGRNEKKKKKIIIILIIVGRRRTRRTRRRTRRRRRNKYMFLIGKSVKVIAFMAMQRYQISLQVLKLFFNMTAKFGISKAAM